jgi:hypothetical protein
MLVNPPVISAGAFYFKNPLSFFDYRYILEIKTREAVMLSKAQLKAQDKYDKAHTKRYSIKLNEKTDADIIEKLKQVDSMQGYIKSLIRADISK